MRSFFFKPLLGLALALLTVLNAPPSAFAATTTEFDEKAAVIFAYLAIGDDSQPFGSLQTDQFMAQIDELSSGPYKVLPLPEIIDAFKKGRKLPDRTIALTFDGADKSLLEKALPLLIEKKLPFTVFIPSDNASQGNFPYMDWADLKRLKKTGLASFGLHPSVYGRLVGEPAEEIKRQLNNSLVKIRKELHLQPDMLAYPFGEYDQTYKKIAKELGFKAAFGQQSGVASAQDDLLALPRFVQTERYGDIERFRMTANALPFPVKDIAPSDPHLITLTPAIGFTVADDLIGKLKGLSCFSSSNEKPVIDILNKVRVELRLEKPLEADRPRINCTLPVAQGVGEEPRWRWFGMLYTLSPELMDELQKKEAASQQAPDLESSMAE